MADLDLSVPQRVHVVGAGGAAMSAMAVILDALGHTVTGSDALDTPYADRLRARGIDLHVGYDAANVGEVDLVAVQSALHDNPEVQSAEARGLPQSRKAIPTETLLASDGRLERSELFWRLSVPILALVLTVLAIPLGQLNPRMGRSFNLLAAAFHDGFAFAIEELAPFLLLFVNFLGEVDVVLGFVEVIRIRFRRLRRLILLLLAGILARLLLAGLRLTGPGLIGLARSTRLAGTRL